MTRVRRFISPQVAILLVTIAVGGGPAPATSLSPVQLRGLKAVNFHVYVSRELEPVCRTLEDRIKTAGSALLRSASIGIGTSKSHLAIDVDVVRSTVESPNGEAVLALRVALRLREPVTLVRNKRLSVPGGGAVIWEDSISDVTTELEAADLVADYSIELVERFAEAVEMVRE